MSRDHDGHDDGEDRAERDNRAERARRYEAFCAAVELPMLVLAVAFVPVVVLPLVWPGMPGGVGTTLGVVGGVLWAAFAAEYAVKLALAPDRRRFVRTHVPDLLLVVVPMLRPLRIARSARALRLLRLTRVVGVGGLAARRSRRKVHTRAAGYAVALAVLLATLAAAVVADAERQSPDATINSFGEGLWWALVTVTTVGYGDAFPVTPLGRVFGAVLMICGIAVLGVVTASIATYFVSHDAAPDADDDLRARLDRIEAELRRLNDAARPAGRGGDRGSADG